LNIWSEIVKPDRCIGITLLFILLITLTGCSGIRDKRVIWKTKRALGKREKNPQELVELRGKLKRIIDTKVRAVELLESVNRALGERYMAIGSYNLAKEVLLEAEYLKPDNAYIKKDLGLCFYFLGQAEKDINKKDQYYTEARDYFESALQLNPELKDARFGLGLLLFFGFNDPYGAIEQMKIILMDDPEHIEAHFALGRFYYETGELGKALNEYITLTRILPSNSPRKSKAEENIIKINRELGYYE